MAAMKKAAVGSSIGIPPVERAQAGARSLPRLLALGVLVAGAFALRAWTIRQSLPYVDHPDEPNPINYIIAMLRTGDPNQQFFQKPSLYIYVLLAALQLHYAWGQAAGLYSDLATMVVTTHTVTTLPGFFLTARLVTAVFGAFTVLSAYALGLRGWGDTAGLAGGLFVAVLPFHLRFSQWATTDVLAALLVSLSLGAALLALRSGRWSAYLVAGAFAGLAASAKYNAGAVAGAIVVAALLRGLWSSQSASHSSRSQLLLGEGLRLAGAGLAAIGCFVAGTPYALLSWSQVGGGIARQWTNYGGANGHYRGAWNIGGYAEFFLLDGLGVAGTLLTLAGLLILARRTPAVLAVWLGFALPSLLIHLSRPTHFMQNMLPLVVACALPVGVVVAELPALLGSRLPHLRPLFLVSLLALVALPPLARSLAYVGRQAAGDSRVQLLNWIDAMVPPGARIAAELKAVPGPTEARWTDVPSLPAHDLAWYRAQGYAYLVGSSKRWGQLSPPVTYGSMLERQVAAFGPRERDEMLGPRLVVIDTGLTAADALVPLDGDVRVSGARLAGVTIGDPSANGQPPMLQPTREFRAGGVLGLRSFWEVREPLAEEYLIFVHLIDVNGGRPTQRDAPPWQGRFPTRVWRPDTLVVDANDVYLPPGMLPGDYRVVIGMYDPVTGARPPVTRDGVLVPESQIDVGVITVLP
jgi:4-amino-4-deoxy-L-arabinose transferase-like glycosyltransferase